MAAERTRPRSDGVEDVSDEIAEDLLGTGEDDPSTIDPTWGPPAESSRRGTKTGLVGPKIGKRLLPGVVIVLAVAFFFGAFAWTLDPTPSLRDEFLPSDGQHTAMTVNDAPGQVEHALGPPGALASEGLVGNAIASDHPGEWFYDGHIYRVLAQSSRETVQVSFGVSDKTLTLDAITSGTSVFISLPGLILSGKQQDSQGHWQAKGTAGLTGQREIDYTAQVARVDHGDCSTWTADLIPNQGSTAQHISVELCRSHGLQRLDYRTGSGEEIRLAPGSGGRSKTYRGETDTPTVSWKDVSTWRSGAVEVNSTDGFGSGPVFVQAQVPPVVLRSGLIVMANLYDQNVTEIAAGSQKDASGDVRWRAHPGGTLVDLVAAENLTVVAITERELVAYDQNGMRVWTARTPRLVTAMTMTGPHRLVTSLGSGEVLAVDPRTGKKIWSAELPEVGNGQIIGNERVVAVADSAGTVKAFDAMTGASLITTRSGNSLPVQALAVADDRLVTLRTNRLEVFDLKSGLFAWGDTMAGIGVGVAASGDTIVYGSSRTTRVAGLADGLRVAELPAVDQVRSLNGLPILVADRQVQAIGSAGQRGPVWDIGDKLESIYECRCTFGGDSLVFSLPDRLVVIRRQRLIMS